MAKQIPNPDLFVIQIRPEERSKVASRLESIGSLEDLDEDNTLLLKVKTARSEPHEQWQQLSEIVGSSGTVQPVLSDETGHPHYPTGELTVRFQKKPSEKQLKEFADEYQLQLRDRNEYVPEQAAFQVTDPSATYLPELVEKIASDEDVKQAWANTRSHYKRIG